MIRLDGVELSFGDLSVLEGVDLAVDRGEFVGLVGPNGAGKTTLLRTINGVLAPDAGTATLDGADVTALPAKAVSRRVATVPQDTHVGFAFTAEQIVEMGRTPHRSRLDWSEDADAVTAALERTETTHLRDRPVDELSGGERQRVLLARALAQDAPATLLDEPTASLDINHQVRVLEVVADLVAAGRAALAAIHDLDLAARYCDRLCLLDEGRIRATGPPERVLDDPALEDAFRTRTAVSTNPATGTPTVTALSDRADRDERVHVVGGGRAGARVVGALWRAGYHVSVGVVGEGDAAAAVADALDVACVTAPPFERPDGATRRAATRLIAAADVVVTTDGPGSAVVGPAVDRHDRVVPVGDGDDATPPGRVREAVSQRLAGRPTEADD